MASSVFYRASHAAKEVDVTELFAKVTIGATGASTLVTAASKGITSVTRNDTGDYTFRLAESYNSLLMIDIMYFHATDKDLTWQAISEDVSDATPDVKIGFHAAATPTDPADGSILYVRLTLKNSSV